MGLKIIRNDITKMKTEAVVNTANPELLVGDGCDFAIHKAAGRKKLLEYRTQNIGKVDEGQSFITPGFNLKSRYIIHTVSPLYIDGNHGEIDRLKSCYRTSLEIAIKNNIKSIAFPLIATGSYMFPKEEGLRIAVDEINAFLLANEMEIYLVVYDEASTKISKKLTAQINEYIDDNYVEINKQKKFSSMRASAKALDECVMAPMAAPMPREEVAIDILEENLAKRLKHTTDTYSEYLLHLIEQKGMTNAEVYNRALVDKKTFSKIKNNSDYHPQKITALCLCVGAKLNMDETKDLLARAGYALSPCDKTDIIFQYFIENKIYDMIELDIQLEEHGLPCLVS